MGQLTVDGYDITSENYSLRPTAPGFLPAFYSTGSATIKATSTMWKAHPTALRIDQANGQDDTADIFDVEPGCYNAVSVVARVKVAMASYKAVKRPGQRWPAVYASRKGKPGYGITDVTNALDAAGLHNQNIGLYIADWNNDRNQAIAEVSNSIPGVGNPYPVVGRQWRNVGPYDLDIFAEEWSINVATPALTAEAPPGPWKDAKEWDWKSVQCTGIGLNDSLYTFTYNPKTGKWDQKFQAA
jgi:hypothetical protein